MYVPVATTGTAANILAVYAAAPQTTRTAGRLWYESAHRQIADLAARHGTTLDTAAAVVAALSPAVRWGLNVAYADQLLAAIAAAQSAADLHLTVYPHNLQRAETIARTGDLAHLRGPKVTAFFANLRNPAHPGPVTVDRHALRIWLYGLDQPPATNLTCTTATFRLAADHYRVAAAELGELPHHVQATTWLHIRGHQP